MNADIQNIQVLVIFLDNHLDRNFEYNQIEIFYTRKINLMIVFND